MSPNKPDIQCSFVEENHPHNSILISLHIKHNAVISNVISVIKRLFHICKRLPIGMADNIIPLV